MESTQPRIEGTETRAARRLQASRESITRIVQDEIAAGQGRQQWERFGALLLRIEADALEPSHLAELDGRREDADRLMSEGLARVRRHWEEVLRCFDLALE